MFVENDSIQIYWRIFSKNRRIFYRKYEHIHRSLQISTNKLRLSNKFLLHRLSKSTPEGILWRSVNTIVVGSITGGLNSGRLFKPVTTRILCRLRLARRRSSITKRVWIRAHIRIQEQKLLHLLRVCNVLYIVQNPYVTQMNSRNESGPEEQCCIDYFLKVVNYNY